eukprot:4704176-Amphidinium_carterae.1
MGRHLHWSPALVLLRGAPPLFSTKVVKAQNPPAPPKPQTINDRSKRGVWRFHNTKAKVAGES